MVEVNKEVFEEFIKDLEVEQLGEEIWHYSNNGEVIALKNTHTGKFYIEKNERKSRKGLDDNKIKDMYVNEKRSVTEISETFNVTDMAIRYRLKKLGVYEGRRKNNTIFTDIEKLKKKIDDADLVEFEKKKIIAMLGDIELSLMY